MKILDSLKSVINEKINSPLAGTFIVSWSIWNWKPIYATFIIQQSILKENKLDYVIPLFNDYSNLIYKPILSTIIIIILLPVISSFVKLWVNYVKKIYTENDLKLRKITPVPREELLAFYEELEKAERTHSEEKEKFIKKIKTLETTINSFKINPPIVELPGFNPEKFNDKNIFEFTKLDYNLFEKIHAKSAGSYKIQWYQNIYNKDENQVIEYIESNKIYYYYAQHKLLENISDNYYKLSKKGISFNAFLKENKFKTD